ncbi:MAG: fibronectin type III domain-containing protein [Limisphaerales bacterium]
MIRNIPKKRSSLLSSSSFAIQGCTKHAAQIVLAYNNAAAITTTREEAVAASSAYEAAARELRTEKNLYLAKAAETRGFVTLCRDLLKRTLGKFYNPAWIGTGFNGSLRVPRDNEALETLIEGLSAYLTANPGKQSADSGITAEIATQLYNTLSTKRHLVQTKMTNLRTKGNVRRQKFAKLRARVIGLYKELSQLIPKEDLRWLDYGFDIPGQPRRPEAPTNVTDILIGTNAISVKWDPTPRAKHYRVWRKIAGVDVDFFNVKSPADEDLTLEGLPGDSLVEIAVSAVNAAGESNRSLLASVQMLC